MSETLTEILQQTSESAPAVETVAESTSSEQNVVGTEQEVPQSIREYLEKNPGHKDIADTLNREFQREFTPKLQRAAELQKLVDGVDPNAISTLRQLQQLAQTNPEQVAQWYRSQADLLHSPQPIEQPVVPDDPWSGLEPVTDVEAKLLEEVKQMNAWRNRWEQEQQNVTLKARANQVKQERDAVQKEFGVQITDQELAQIWDVSERSGLPIRQTYLALNSERVLPTLLQRARDEASGVVQNKLNLAAGNPAGVPQRSAGNPTVKGSLHDYFAEAKNQ